MKRLAAIILLLSALLPGIAREKADTVTVWMAGDSTMADKPVDGDKQERGWGQMFPMMLQGSVRVANHARNGRSSKSFIDQGLWDRMLRDMRPGDWLIVQFGHNDAKPDSARHTVPGGSFDECLRRYVRQARERGVQTILMNSIVRRNFPDGPTLVDTHGAYLESPARVAREEGCWFIDFNRLSHDYIQATGPERSKGVYMWLPDGKQDNTHFCIHGATEMARLAAEAICRTVPALAPYIHSAPVTTSQM